MPLAQIKCTLLLCRLSLLSGTKSGKKPIQNSRKLIEEHVDFTGDIQTVDLTDLKMYKLNYVKGQTAVKRKLRTRKNNIEYWLKVLLEVILALQKVYADKSILAQDILPKMWQHYCLLFTEFVLVKRSRCTVRKATKKPLKIPYSMLPQIQMQSANDYMTSLEKQLLKRGKQPEELTISHLFGKKEKKGDTRDTPNDPSEYFFQYVPALYERHYQNFFHSFKQLFRKALSHLQEITESKFNISIPEFESTFWEENTSDLKKRVEFLRQIENKFRSLGIEPLGVNNEEQISMDSLRATRSMFELSNSRSSSPSTSPKPKERGDKTKKSNDGSRKRSISTGPLSNNNKKMKISSSIVANSVKLPNFQKKEWPEKGEEFGRDGRDGKDPTYSPRMQTIESDEFQNSSVLFTQFTPNFQDIHAIFDQMTDLQRQIVQRQEEERDLFNKQEKAKEAWFLQKLVCQKFEEKAIEKIASLDKRLEKLKQEKLALENEKQENQAKFATEKEKYANTFNKLSTIKAKAYSDHVRCLNSLRELFESYDQKTEEFRQQERTILEEGRFTLLTELEANIGNNGNNLK